MKKWFKSKIKIIICAIICAFIFAGVGTYFLLNSNLSQETNAVQLQMSCGVMLNDNGGSGGSGECGINSTELTYNYYHYGYYYKVSIPTKSGDTFCGYYSSTTGGTQWFDSNGYYVYSGSSVSSGLVQLYAHWAGESSGGGTSTGGGEDVDTDTLNELAYSVNLNGGYTEKSVINIFSSTAGSGTGTNMSWTFSIGSNFFALTRSNTTSESYADIHLTASLVAGVKYRMHAVLSSTGYGDYNYPVKYGDNGYSDVLTDDVLQIYYSNSKSSYTESFMFGSSTDHVFEAPSTGTYYFRFKSTYPSTDPLFVHAFYVSQVGLVTDSIDYTVYTKNDGYHYLLTLPIIEYPGGYYSFWVTETSSKVFNEYVTPPISYYYTEPVEGAKYANCFYSRTYKVTFDYNSSLNKTDVLSSALPESVEVPTREGYIFTGYVYSSLGYGNFCFYNADGKRTEIADPSTFNLYIPDANINLVAQWEKIYTIYYKHMIDGDVTKFDGVGTEVAYVTYDSPMPDIVAPMYAGKYFLGYYTATTGGTEYYDELVGHTVENFTLTEDLTLYAQWEGDTWARHYSQPSGNGSSGNPYIIDSAAKLGWIAYNVELGNNFSGNYFKQTSNIDLSGHYWLPIGRRESNVDRTFSFAGNYDGGNYQIKNINTYTGTTSNPCETVCAALFGLPSGATISNIVISSGTINGGNHVGSIAGYAINSTIRNCINMATIGSSAATEGVGGIVGVANSSATITGCMNLANVTGKNYAGGIVGISDAAANQTVSVTNCYASCTVTAEDYHGGLVGRVSPIANSTTNISSSVFSGTIAQQGTEYAFFVGSKGSGSTTNITDCLCISSNWGNSAGTNGSGTSNTYNCMMRIAGSDTGWDSDGYKDFSNWTYKDGSPYLPKGVFWIG